MTYGSLRRAFLRERPPSLLRFIEDERGRLNSTEPDILNPYAWHRWQSPRRRAEEYFR